LKNNKIYISFVVKICIGITMTETMTPSMSVTPGLPVFPWWLVLIQGIITLILGIFFLTYPYGTLLVLVTFLGAYWFISGLIGLFSLAVDKTNAGWKIVFGILGVIAGIAILAYPYYSALVVPYIFIIFVGVWGLIMGFVSLFAAFKGGGWGAGIIGVLLIIFGCIILANPLVTTLILPFVLGVFGIIGGIIAIIGSIYLKGHPMEVKPA
jgi:uncharacterized membrane protein HdeD (DUF308 family)